MNLPGIIVFLLIPSYAISLLLYSGSETSLLRRILLSTLLAVSLAVFWTITRGYISSGSSNFSYTILSILIIICILIAHFGKTIVSRKKSKETSTLNQTSPFGTKKDSNPMMQSARFAAMEKKKSMLTGTEIRRFNSNNGDYNENRIKSEKLEILRPKKPAYDIYIIISVALVSLIINFLPLLNQNPLKIAILSILVFGLQGYAVLTAILPDFNNKSLLKRILLSIVVSIIILLFIGTISSILNLDTSAAFVIMLIAVIALCMSLIAYLKRSKDHEPIKESFKTSIKKSVPDDLRIYTPADARTGKLLAEENEEEPEEGEEEGDARELEEIKEVEKIGNGEDIGETKGIEKLEPLEDLEDIEDAGDAEYEKDLEGVIRQERYPKTFQKEEMESIIPKEDYPAQKTVEPAKKPETVLEESEKSPEKYGVSAESTEPPVSEIYEESELSQESTESKASGGYEDYEEYRESPETSTRVDLPEIPNIQTSEYTQRMHKYNLLKLVLVAFFSILAASLVVVPVLNNQETLKLIFFIPLVFFISGYSIKELFLPNRLKGTLKTVLSSVILSVFLVTILGLVLPLLLKNAQNTIYIIILSSISLICIIAAFIRNRKHFKSVNEVLERIEIDRVIKSVQTLDKEINNPSMYENLDQFIEDKMLEDDLKLSFLSEEYFQNKTGKSTGTSFNKTKMEMNLKRNVEGNPKKHMESNPEKLSSSLSGRPDKPKPPSRFSLLGNDLFLLFLIIIINLGIMITPSLQDTIWNTIFGLIFLLFIPGYMLVGALFPRQKDLDGLERLALSFGLSLAISALIGLSLNYTPYGITWLPLVITLNAFSIIMGVLAIIRRRMVGDDSFHFNLFSSLGKVGGSFQTESRLDKILSVILVISLLVAISMTAYLVLMPKEGEKFTEFYVLGPNGQASGYPTNLTLGETGIVKVGIVNHEYSTINYKLVIKLNGTIIEEKEIKLSNNQTWQQNFDFTPTMTGTDKKLEFLLYKLPDETNIYRSLHLYVSVY